MKLEDEQFMKIAEFATEIGMSPDEIKGVFIYGSTAMCAVDMRASGRNSVAWINSDD